MSLQCWRMSAMGKVIRMRHICCRWRMNAVTYYTGGHTSTSLIKGLRMKVLAELVVSASSGPLVQSMYIRLFPFQTTQWIRFNRRPLMKYTRNQGRWIWNNRSSSLANLASTLAKLESMAGWLLYAPWDRKVGCWRILWAALLILYISDCHVQNPPEAGRRVEDIRIC
jgi:hypothetical protein